MIIIFFRLFNESFKNIKRNLVLVIPTIFSITISLYVLALFLILNININFIATKIEQNFKIHAMLEYEYENDEQIKNIAEKINSIPGVLKTTFVSKDEELDFFIQQENVEKSEELYKEYKGKNNPLRHAFLITVTDGTKILDISNKIKRFSGIYRVNSGGLGTKNFMIIMKNIKNFSFIIAVFLFIITIFLLINTIRVSIYSRYREIFIMRTIGATNWYIKLPFIFEGILIGIGGSFFPVLSILFGYSYLYSKINNNFFSGLFSLVSKNKINLEVSIIIVFIGCFIGAFGSFFSVKKFLKWSR